MAYKKSQKKQGFSAEIQGNQIGKLPPQAVDLEEIVLGAMLLEREAIEAVIAILNTTCFYKDAHGLVFDAILALYKRSEPADILTVTKELAKTGDLEKVGGPYFISTLTTRVVSSANIVTHAYILLQQQLKRDLIQINTSGIKEAYEDNTDVFELFAKQNQMLDGCLDGVIKYEAKSIGDAHADSIMEHLDVLKTGKVSGVPTGFRQIDRFLAGWQKSDLIILGARPGMGKTSCVVAFAKNAAMNGRATAIFSLEMSTKQLTDKIQSDISEIPLTDIIKKNLTQEQIREMDDRCQELYKAPLYIDDTPALTLLELKAKARKLVSKQKVELIIIDYLQLMSGGTDSKGNREQEISAISRGLKALAKELNVSIIALSQLSRAVENRPDKKPQLSDLRESGAIEQDADMVLFAFRPEYYKLEEYFVGNEVFPAAGLFALIVAKNRHGSLGDLLLGWVPECTKLTNYDFVNKCPQHIPKNIIAQTNNNFENSKENDTFVQPITKFENNVDFLSQKPENVNNNENPAF